MIYLLDTNVFIFVVQNIPDRLSAQQEAVLRNKKNQFVVSGASLYEMGIKRLSAA